MIKREKASLEHLLVIKAIGRVVSKGSLNLGRIQSSSSVFDDIHDNIPNRRLLCL